MTHFDKYPNEIARGVKLHNLFGRGLMRIGDTVKKLFLGPYML